MKRWIKEERDPSIKFIVVHAPERGIARCIQHIQHEYLCVRNSLKSRKKRQGGWLGLGVMPLADGGTMATRDERARIVGSKRASHVTLNFFFIVLKDVAKGTQVSQGQFPSFLQGMANGAKGVSAYDATQIKGWRRAFWWWRSWIQKQPQAVFYAARCGNHTCCCHQRQKNHQNNNHSSS